MRKCYFCKHNFKTNPPLEDFYFVLILMKAKSLSNFGTDKNMMFVFSVRKLSF